VVEVSAAGDAARMEGVPFAVGGFMRSNAGSAKEYNGTSYGYRYPMAAQDALAVVVTGDEVVVYVPAQAATQVGLDSKAATARDHLWQLLAAIDAQVAHGGIEIQSFDAAHVTFTSDPAYQGPGYRFAFGIEAEPGYYYACVYPLDDAPNPTPATPAAPSAKIPGFCDTALLVPAAQAVISVAPTGLDAVAQFFAGIDYRPFWVSLRTSFVALLFVFVLGLAAAHFSLKMPGRLKDVLDSLFTIPMVLPPTVCGFLLLVTFGNSTGLGRWLMANGIELVFSWPAAVLAATVVAFPLMYRTARGAFEAQDPALFDAARTLGWSEGRIFFKLALPLSWPSIAAGTVLAFARAMGEFGATLFVAGNYAGQTQTMPIAIYFQWMGGHSDVATFWVFVVILISFVVILFINWYASRTQRYRRASASTSASTDKGDRP
jgi:molybdate transport system permease protein